MVSAPAPWLAFLWVLPLAGCLQASVAPLDGVGPEGTHRVPSIAFVKDESGDQVVVQAVESYFAWAHLGLSASVAGTLVRATDTDGTGQPVELVPSEFRRPSASPGDVMAGDVFRFCAAAAVEGPVTYSIAERTTNTLVYQATFETVASCG